MRESVSDHAPVWISLGEAELTVTAFNGNEYTAANEDSFCLDLNEATVDQLAELPNVGSVRAEQIISKRPWDGINELTRVRGLGEASVQEIQNSGLLCN